VIRVRLMLVRFPDDTEPVVVGAVDETVLEHWDESIEAAWRRACEETWGADPTDCEWREIWAEFAPQDLVDAFETPVVQGIAISHSETR
jgi:hypothetical protein